MFHNSTTAMLTTLRGMPFTVLMALLLSPVLPIGEMEVAAMIGINRKTVRQHLRFLKSLGLVVRSGYKESWMLADGALQLPLPFRPLSAGATQLPPYSGSDTFTGEGNFYPHDALLFFYRSEEINNTTNKKKKSAAREGNFYPHVGNHNKTQKPTYGGTAAAKEGLIQAFQEAGIGMSVWEELAGCEWITADYVRAHTAQAQRNGDPAGYQIQRMRSGLAPTLPAVVLKKGERVCSKCETAVIGELEQMCESCLGRLGIRR